MGLGEIHKIDIWMEFPLTTAVVCHSLLLVQDHDANLNQLKMPDHLSMSHVERYSAELNQQSFARLSMAAVLLRKSQALLPTPLGRCREEVVENFGRELKWMLTGHRLPGRE